jgi:hypothetical protein
LRFQSLRGMIHLTVQVTVFPYSGLNEPVQHFLISKIS